MAAGRAARLVVSAIVVTAALSVPGVSSPAPAQATCGTRWTSRVRPPTSIRVLRTASGRVETVAFKRYVGEVMASGEWPSYLPMAELEAGAVAVKQYAWYYALEGHHRSWYRTASGICYDVRDDTNDQLFRPAAAEPTAKQLRAVELTWGSSLRKHGRFFLTGYRPGTAWRCAADANGWRLFARSVRDCAARLGWSRTRIQRAYYSPGLAFVWAPGSAGLLPEPGRPRTRLVRWSTYPDAPAVVWWRAPEDAGEVVAYQLQRRRGTRPWRTVELADPLATSVHVPLLGDRRHQFRVRARTADGAGSWQVSRRLTVRLRQPGVAAFDGEAWTSVADATAVSGSLRSTSASSHRVRLRFTGRAVAYLAPTGPGAGPVRILVKGREVARVDLAAEAASPRRLVWVRTWRRSAERRVVVESLVDGARVDVDGFLVLR
jgi:hypothetical protein